MHIAMDECSDAYNLTECLLLHVLDAIKDHNRWDAPSLAIMTVTGVAAALISLLAVIQGILSTGVGRRKCSRATIGEWKRNTEWRWNWSELRVEWDAHTPVLTANVMHKKLRCKLKQLEKEEEPAKPPKLETEGRIPNSSSKGTEASIWSCALESPKIDVIDIDSNKEGMCQATNGGNPAIPNRSIKSSEDKSRRNPVEPYLPATWLHILAIVGMDGFVLNNFADRTKRVAADFLPSEVQAVPAYMDIDTIVVLAATAGCDRLTMEPGARYPLITGTNVQVRFRTDQYLGDVASFERYAHEDDGDGSSAENLEERQIRKLLSNFNRSRGYFRIKKAKKTKSGKALSMNVLDSVSELTYPSSDEADIDGAALEVGTIEMKAEDGRPCCHSGAQLKLCCCLTILHDLVKRHNFSWLLYAEPIEQREIFPARSANVERVLGTIVVQGAYWSRSHERWILKKLGKADWKDFWHELALEGHEIRAQDLFTSCLHFVADVGAAQQSFLRIPYCQKVKFRKVISAQMSAIDEAINRDNRRPDSSARCTRIELYIKAATLMGLEALAEGPKNDENKKAASSVSGLGAKQRVGSIPRKILGYLKNVNEEKGEALVRLYHDFLGRFEDCWPAEADVLIKSLFDLASVASLDGSENDSGRGDDVDKASSGDFDPISFLIKQADTMTELLIYRVVLLAMSCFTALDNSLVIESGIGSQIVPFL